MTRLPQPGGDNGNWGNILNDYLSQVHNADGTLKDDSVSTNQLQDNSVTANTIAPGAVTKTTIGLANVDNTADTNKPISTATQTALNTKLATTDLDTQTATNINDNASATAGALSGSYAQIPRVFPPSGFPVFVKLPTPRVYRLGGGRFRGVLNLSTLKPSGGTTYYVDRAGSGGNTGLTPGSPWNIGTAIAAVNAGAGGDTIRMLNATDEYQGTNWAMLTKSCQIVADSPGVRATNWPSAGFTWTAVSGLAGADDTVYSTPKGTINGVFDLLNTYTWTDYTGRVHRNYTEYVNKGTGANQAAALALITGDGQWSQDGTNVYVRPTGAMDLTDSTARRNLRVRQGSGTGIIADGAGVVVYLRGIAFEGHSYMRAQNNAIVVAEDCSFKYKTGDGTTHDGGHVVHVRCVASGNGSDGFNYHDAAGNGSEFIEIDCVSGYNGMQRTDDINNASTCHDDCRGIRVGGSYSHTNGPTIADVNSAKTWNLGVDARDSYAIISTQRGNYFCDTTSEVWLDECSSDGPNVNGGTGVGYNFKANGAGAKIHLSGFRGAAHPKSVEVSTGTVDYYTPTDAA